MLYRELLSEIVVFVKIIAAKPVFTHGLLDKKNQVRLYASLLLNAILMPVLSMLKDS